MGQFQVEQLHNRLVSVEIFKPILGFCRVWIDHKTGSGVGNPTRPQLHEIAHRSEKLIIRKN